VVGHDEEEELGELGDGEEVEGVEVALGGASAGAFATSQGSPLRQTQGGLCTHLLDRCGCARGNAV